VNPDLQFGVGGGGQTYRSCSSELQERVSKIMSELENKLKKVLNNLATETFFVCNKQLFLLCHFMPMFYLLNVATQMKRQPVYE
jgi:hypothetical protein